MRRVFEGRERERRRRIAIDSENCRDRGERGARTPRLYKNTKTFYKPERITRASASPGTREKKMESAESENGRLQRMNAWVVEVREDGMRCIDLSMNDVYGDGDTF